MDEAAYAASLDGIDFRNPFAGYGEQVGSLAEAGRYAHLDIKVPSNAGVLQSVFVTKPQPPGPDSDPPAVAMVFQSPEYGLVDFLEGVHNMTPEDWLKFVKFWGDESNRDGRALENGSAELVWVHGTNAGLLTTATDLQHSELMWMEGDVKFVVFGPSLDRTAVLSIANEV